MNTIQANFLYNLIFSETKYKNDGNFLGNKAFVRKNNKLAQIEFLKGNKIGDNKDRLRDLTIKVKLKSVSENEEEIETCMSFYDETHRSFLVEYDKLNDIKSPNICDINAFATLLTKIFCPIEKNNTMNVLCAEIYCKSVLEKDFDLKNLSFDEIDEYCLKYYFFEIGKNITSFLDFMFE